MQRARQSWMLLLLVLGLSLLMFAGCGDDGDDDDPDDPVDPVALVRQGWSAFESLNYNKAADLFTTAIDHADDMADAYSGAGWTYYMIADNEMAREAWEDGLDRDPANYDIRAGLGALQFQQEQYADAVATLTGLLDDNANYSFIHLDGLDYRDIRVTLAMSHYMVGEFDQALAQVRSLNAVFMANVDTVETPEQVSKLAKEIERLSQLYRG